MPFNFHTWGFLIIAMCKLGVHSKLCLKSWVNELILSFEFYPTDNLYASKALYQAY